MNDGDSLGGGAGILTLQDAREAGIEHEEFVVRSAALNLLSNERSVGRGAAMSAIRQIEKYGWWDSFEFPCQIRKLPHCEESVEWVAARLEESAAATDRVDEQHHLATWFCEAPLEWLFPRIDRFVETLEAEWPPETGSARSIPVTFANPQVSFARVVDRLEASRWSATECREKLDQVLESCVATTEFPHDEIRRLEVICEVLAARGWADEEVTGIWLDLADLDPERDAGAADYRVGASLIILGHGKLRPPVARIVRLFDLDWDWINELVEEAIVAGGDAETLREVLRVFPRLEWHAKLYLVAALDRLRFDGFEETLIELVRSEEDDELRVRLARALALYGSERAVTVAKEIVMENPNDIERQAILDNIYVGQILTGRTSNDARTHVKRMERRYQLRVQRIAMFERLTESGWGPAKPGKSESFRSVPPSSLPILGRNDPCHCGSGKKFKKCCGVG